MALVPHYKQAGSAPAVVGAGSGSFDCDCRQSTLIAGYEPRNFLNIAIQCATCGRISETPGLGEGAAPAPQVSLLERGLDHPPASVPGSVALISREEMDRLTAYYLPRATGTDPHVISDALLDDVELRQRHWTGEPLDPAPRGYKQQPLAWAVARLRTQLRQPDWAGFTDNADRVAAAVVAAFRDLFASWSHHPMFDAMVGTAAAQGFSLHGMAMFGAAKALITSGNQIAFVPTEEPRPRIASLQMVLGPQELLSVAVIRFDKFEWPDPAEATPQSIRAAVIEAMASVQGSINRLRPGTLILSPGAIEKLDQPVIDAMFAAIGSHGKRHRGLAAVAAVVPKIFVTGRYREVLFGYSFYPVPNRSHSIGQLVRIGTRADHTA